MQDVNLTELCFLVTSI